MSKRVLVIEDNQSLVANLFAYLEPRQYSLDAAHDGQAGLHLALTSDYDVIVLDWVLPRLNGDELVKRLQEQRAAKRPSSCSRLVTSCRTRSRGFAQGLTTI